MLALPLLYRSSVGRAHQLSLYVVSIFSMFFFHRNFKFILAFVLLSLLADSIYGVAQASSSHSSCLRIFFPGPVF